MNAEDIVRSSLEILKNKAEKFLSELEGQELSDEN